MQQPVICEVDRSQLGCATAPSDRFIYSTYFKALLLQPPEGTPDPQDIELLHQLLASELGWLFLDRTRIRPAGFAIGEHVFSLSLAPGEEVVTDQRTFSKRETTFEDQTEQEQQTELEMSSTLTTELTEGVERETSRSDQSGFNVGGSASGNIYGVDVKLNAGYSRSVTEASNESRQRSVKDSSTATSKVASKYRALHKMTFKVSTEERFEQGSKRVIRNPNQFTPIDLHYFKLLRRLAISQERYGVRLAWAPAIEDPAADVVERIATGRRAIVDRILSQVEIPPRPPEPAKPQKPAIDAASSVVEADKWGVTGDMRADYDVPIDIPQDFVWNGDDDEVGHLTSVWGRPPENMGWHIVGMPVVRDGRLVVRIHVGAGSWIGGPKVFMQAKARFMPRPADEDPAYQQAYREWQAKVAQWEADKAAALAGPTKRAQEEADAWERAIMATLNPVVALMDRIAKTHLVGEMSNEPWEVEFWRQVFDWDRAGISLYPSWWSTRPVRDYLRAPDDFLNASWARLYLPVRPGFERLALRWIVGRVRDTPLDPAIEAAFARVATELEEYRKATFGAASETKLGGTGGDELQEQFLTLAKWTETLPTDGTHVEVVQASTSAVDDVSRAQLEVAARTAIARVAGEEQDIELKKKAVSTFKPPNVEVRIATEPGDTDGR
jgi:hypothetical protein